MLRTTKITITSAAIALSAGGCVDEFSGSNIQIDLRNTTATSSEFPVQAKVGSPPGPGELAANTHFTLYVIPDPTMPTNLVELQRFEVHRLVDPTSPCFIDVGEHVPHPGLHISQFANKIAEDTGFVNGFDLANPPPGASENDKVVMASAEQRQENVAKIAGDLADEAGDKTGMRAATSASTTVYGGFAPDCNPAGNLFPPTTCITDEANLRRLKLCQDTWAADKNMFEGTDRVLTAPINGVNFGMVDGENPVNESPVGGTSFFVNNPLTRAQFYSYVMYSQVDGVDGLGQRIAGSVAVSMPTRGVIRVTMAGAPLVAGQPPIIALMAIFPNLDDDSTTF